ncbi:TPA: O-antigen polymerase, partial [Citrobacter farmeri]|nr:O-antigen polymerase [Citrobacter farmeri]HCB1459310.1 O-antigen ligase C-terminal domain-containing protein [Citrobacter farmeri]HCB1610127.1 O-antigen ligase C-terminal domain-containing protein [Citrobacter farmeri]
VSAVAVLILPAVLVILQSRAGSLGAASGVILLSLSKWPQQKRRITNACLLITAGIGIGLAGLHLINVIYPDFSVIVDKENSTSARIYMLKLTWQLILTHPIMGCGYGSFESLFGQLAQITPPGLEADTMQYPHNELLYAWVEGGIVAVIGILLIVVGILKRLWGKGGTKYAGVALLLPLAIHTNLEYPLYQSATHCLTLIMLLVISGRQIVTTHEDEIKQPYRVWRIPAGILTVAILLFMITGLQTQARITKIEQQGLMPLAVNEQAELKALLNPYSQYERLEFDRHVAMLLKFNLTRDPALLEQFRHWAEAYLELHNDPSVYASLLMIARAYHQPNAENICQQAKGRWLSDPRFVCAEKK